MKKTKIVATIGPASLKRDVIEKMIKSGMNVARLNFSHSDHAWHAGAITLLRDVSDALDMPLAIIADLQGPRIRTSVSESFRVEEGEEITLHDEAGELGKRGHSIQIDQEGILPQLKVSQQVTVEDGTIIFELTEKKENTFIARALNSGTIQNHKGMNFPGAGLKLATLTEKDELDLAFVLKYKPEYVALSFVGAGKQVEDLRDRMRALNTDEHYWPEIIVKIERRSAIQNIDEIIEATDAVMVARGDLAIEAGSSKVGILQKEIIQKSLGKAKPVIVATQMLDSMITNPQPTRAEISDVTNAVIDHTDATMLSGETANGAYPVECIQMMASIIQETEESPFDDILGELQTNVQSRYVDVIRSVYSMARGNPAKAILVVTHSGVTARLISHFRPETPMYVAALREDVYRKLALLWGARAYRFKNTQDEKGVLLALMTMLIEEGKLERGGEAVCVYRAEGEKTKTIQMRESGADR